MAQTSAEMPPKKGGVRKAIKLTKTVKKSWHEFSLRVWNYKRNAC
jgi:hypothetical protein